MARRLPYTPKSPQLSHRQTTTMLQQDVIAGTVGGAAFLSPHYCRLPLLPKTSAQKVVVLQGATTETTYSSPRWRRHRRLRHGSTHDAIHRLSGLRFITYALGVGHEPYSNPLPRTFAHVARFPRRVTRFVHRGLSDGPSSSSRPQVVFPPGAAAPHLLGMRSETGSIFPEAV